MAQGIEHKPTEETRKLVESLSGCGLPHEQIGCLVAEGITPDTLVKYYSKELDAGKAKASAKIGRTLFQKATEDRDTTALIWWTKTQMRWKGVEGVEHSGAVEVTEIKRTIVDPKA